MKRRKSHGTMWNELCEDSRDRFIDVVVSDLRGYLSEPVSDRIVKYALASVLQSAEFVYLSSQRQLGHDMVHPHQGKVDGSASYQHDSFIVCLKGSNGSIGSIHFPWTSDREKLKPAASQFLQFIFETLDS